MLGGSGDADEVATELRECSQAEAGLQARLRGVAESVTEAEVSAAHLRDRREETMAEIQRVEETLKRKLEPPAAPLEADEREEIERKLERLGNRREQLGPVNPLAEREYADALEHVTELEEQRTDLEGALGELRSLILETDAKIESAFEQTFEATEKNFEELVEHLFPGGRGRLRLVGEKGPKLVLGGQDAPVEEGTVPTTEEAEDAEESFMGQGVEIEVTPAGKATR
jgi:chromosome segregation protein